MDKTKKTIHSFSQGICALYYSHFLIYQIIHSLILIPLKLVMACVTFGPALKNHQVPWHLLYDTEHEND